MGKRYRNNRNRGLENFCLSVIKWGTYLALFTPLIISRGSFFPFVTPKTIYFRVLVEIIFGAFLVLAIYVPEYRPRLNILSISIFIFIGVIILTSFLGVNPERSFWSTYERMTGIFTFFHLLAFFIVLASVFKKRDDWDKILSVSIFVGVLLCLYVLIAGGGEISTRGGGTIGNTSFMAAYLLFDIFFALTLFLEKKTSGWRIFSGISLFIMILVLLASDARGVIVSFLGGLFLLFLSYLIFSGKKNLKKMGIFLILLLVLVTAILLIFQPPFIEDNIGLLLIEMKPRFVVWEKAWKGFLERPLFGWGPENFNVVFNKFFNSCMFTVECGSEIWFDRAHNIILDRLVTTGIIGLLSYLLIFVASILGLLKTYLGKKENIFSFLTMMVLLIVYFFQNLFVFDMISSYAIFFLSLGFIYFLIEGERDFSFQPVKEQEKNSLVNGLLKKDFSKYIVFSTVIVLSSLLLYFGNIQPADSAVNIVSLIVTSEGLEKVMEYYKEASDTFMEKYEAREQFSQRLYTFNFDTTKEDMETVKSAFELAEEKMEEGMKKNSLDFRTHLFSARLYFSDYRVTQDLKKLDISEDLFKKAIELSPTNQQGYWYLADVKLVRGEQEEALRLFQKAVDLEPKFGRSHWYLSMIYQMRGEYEKALEKAEDAEEAGYKWKRNLNELNRVIDIYDILKDDSGLVALYQEVLDIHPEEAELWAGLAAAYANLGEKEKAKEAAQRAKEIDSSLAPKIEQFLSDLSEE